MSTLIQLNSVFQEVFDDPNLALRPETSPADIPEWDSIAQVKLVLSTEEAFAIQFAAEELASMYSVGDFVAAIERQKGLSS
jgi:acyl carrier protein